MALPLLEYKPSAQNQRVRSFVADLDGDRTYTYRQEEATSPLDIEQLIWAAYRQVFNEQEILRFNRQITLETQLKNRSISVRDFIRGLAKSERFYRLVVEPNNNYRLVEIVLKRLLGRAPYNREEEIARSIQIATLGWEKFVDTLIDSEEYAEAFGNYTVPYQRQRMMARPFSFTPRYGADYRDRAGIPLTWEYESQRRPVVLTATGLTQVDWSDVTALVVGLSATIGFYFLLMLLTNSLGS